MHNNDTTPEGKGSANAIHTWGAEWSHKFRTVLERGWPLAEVAALHDDLDRIASAADGLGDSELATAAVELSVYLCSFVEDGRNPDAGQREKLLRLGNSLGGEVDTTAVRPVLKAAPSRLAHLLCVSEDAGLAAELGLRLAERGVAMSARSTVDDALCRPPEHGMHVVLVDETQLDGLLRLERAALTLGGDAGRPLFAALLRRNSLEHRMRALRGGADAVIEFENQPARLAERAARLLRERDSAPLRAMIIDDDRSQAMFCESVLRHAGVETRLYTDAHQAFAEFSDFRPEVVLVDLYMPDMDGMSLVAALRAQPEATAAAIVFLSGAQDSETRFEALAAGGDDFLNKPILPRHLVAAVLTRGRRMRQLHNAVARATAAESAASNVRELNPRVRSGAAH
ncbi:MAG TPA: response regulator [Rhodanobacteraceae bacterium]|nr:response regulator [Rhodanobacteraceae bacterium]